MRILHVIPSLDPRDGGPVEGVRLLGDCYSECGGTLDVVCGISSDDEVAVRGDIYRFKPFLGRYSFNFSMLRWLIKNTKKYDIVLVDGLWQFCGVAVLIASLIARGEARYYVFTHGMLDPWFKKSYPLKYIKKLVYWFFIERWVLSFAKGVLYTCEEEKISAQKTFPFFNVNSQHIVGYGTEVPYGQYEELKCQLYARWPELLGKKIIISIGRIHEKKGCDLLIEGFSKFARHASEYKLLIVGDGDKKYVDYLKGIAAQCGVSGDIVWAGMLVGSEKWACISLSDVFCLPSHQENFGVVVAEAAGFGKPLLISDKVNIWREVDIYKAGIVCTDSVEGVLDVLNSYNGLSADEQVAMGRSAKRLYLEKLRMSEVAKKIMNLVVG